MIANGKRMGNQRLLGTKNRPILISTLNMFVSYVYAITIQYT